MVCRHEMISAVLLLLATKVGLCAEAGGCGNAASGSDGDAVCAASAAAEQGMFQAEWWLRDADAEAAKRWKPVAVAADVDEALPLPAADHGRSSSSCASAIGEALSPLLSIKVALAAQVPRGRAEDASQRLAFVMMNGGNEGVFWRFPMGCDRSLARLAARALGATALDVQRPLRLYTPGGRGLESGADDALHAKIEFLHVLLEGETWIWPGVEVGFRWQAAGLELETLSIAPKVILARNVLTAADVNEVNESFAAQLEKSKEKHYSPGFENYRTSYSAYFSGSTPAGLRIRKLTRRVMRLPFLDCVEAPQLLRYRAANGEDREHGEWYKRHQDIFHNYRPLASAAGDATAWLQTAEGQASELAAALQGCQDQSDWNRAQLAICQGLLDQAPSADGLQAGDSHRPWLKENIERCSAGLLTALLKSRPGLLAAAKRVFQAATDEPDEEEGGAQVAPQRFVQPNRHATMLIYLNDVTKGGETVFPLVPGLQREDLHPGMAECAQGLAVRPVALGAAIFYHMHGNGTADILSSHSGCPPLQGEKWAINSFMWNVPFSEGIQHYGH
eukprot:TRINITY_DN44756_c0_g1_i2.p1 TRINITY_DN44756_c0_g1~~TRINITY_DN44756_c0_g1_i2.p1  ORF type:complete len:562 (-),score=126.32 TRINITY_DN44756_c0_g1_i2:393-2078(-)